MTLPKSEQKRPYSQHGHCAVLKALKTVGNQDEWIDKLGEALKTCLRGLRRHG